MSLLVLAILTVGCSSSTSSSKPVAPATPTDPVAAQVAQGKDLYVAHCAKCHGNAGEGTKDGPVVVGAGAFPLDPRPGAKRAVRFKTAADVFTWAAANMPGDAPGSLSTDQLLAVFAFDLTANGVKLAAPLDGTAAAAIVLHP